MPVDIFIINVLYISVSIRFKKFHFYYEDFSDNHFVSSSVKTKCILLRITIVFVTNYIRTCHSLGVPVIYRYPFLNIALFGLFDTIATMFTVTCSLDPVGGTMH